jgi:multiple antibiotic resistance protein
MIIELLSAFIPIFVAVDAIGTLPIYISLTRGIKNEDRKRIILQSIATALCLAVGFIILGRVIFEFLGISMGDFMIAGGAILFSIAILDIVRPDKDRPPLPVGELGAVPLGTPLIVGPGVLTTSLMMVDQHGLPPTLTAIFLNIILAGIVFNFSDQVIKIFGQAGSRALSKVMALLLAAIAIMMIRKGIVQVIAI